MPCHAGISTGVGCKRISPARRLHLQEDIFVRPEIIVAGDSDGFQVELGVSNNLVVIVKSKPGWSLAGPQSSLTGGGHDHRARRGMACCIGT